MSIFYSVFSVRVFHVAFRRKYSQSQDFEAEILTSYFMSALLVSLFFFDFLDLKEDWI